MNVDPWKIATIAVSYVAFVEFVLLVVSFLKRALDGIPTR